jgi:hypothetical protein
VKVISWGIFLLIIASICILLVPAVYNPPVRAPTAATQHAVDSLTVGLVAFKQDFGAYPPSRWTSEPAEFQEAGPAACLMYYLGGPTGEGWGTPAGNALPFGGTSDRTFVPYYYEDSRVQSTTKLRPPMDAFNPPKPILYFRAEPGREPLFDAADVPLDPTGQTGFASQEHFEMLVRPKGKWGRKDYLLIAAGPCRVFGPVKPEYDAEGRPTGRMLPNTSGEWDAETVCDSIANFSHP